jgi:hypothetical protein
MNVAGKLLLLGLLCCAGCTSGVVNPWIGDWHAAEDRLLRFRDNGKVEYYARGTRYADGTYTRLGSQAARLDLKAKSPPPDARRSSRMQIIKLGDTRSFEFNRLTFRRRR